MVSIYKYLQLKGALVFLALNFTLEVDYPKKGQGEGKHIEFSIRSS